TASADASDVNSVIQLAGLRPAEAPVRRTVSADTQILLSAIGSLERRLEPPDGRDKALRFFRIEEDKVIFEDNTDASLGEEVYGPKANLIGQIVDIHPSEGRIYVRNREGKVMPFAANSIKSKGMTTLPF